MSKTFAAFTLILIFFHSSLIGQKILTPEEQLEDLTYLIKRLEEIHPNPYAYLSKEDFYQKVEILKQKLSTEMNSIEFAKLLMPLVSALGDAHTEIEVPRKEFRAFKEAGGNVFPFSIDIRDDQLFVRDHPSYEGAEILEINHKPLAQILPAIRSYVSAEREAFREVVIERNWQSYACFELGEIHSITLDLDGKKSELKNWEELSLPQKASAYELELKENQAWIHFNRMSNLGAFKKFLKRSFQSIEEQSIDTLIIDLRQNGGGDSRLGDVLISYLHESKYNQVDMLEVKASASQKAYFHQTYIPFFLKPFLPLFKLNPVLRATFG
ncbi:MAG: S41 family peptidase, partial [Bacteroidota bacterium]